MGAHHQSEPAGGRGADRSPAAGRVLLAVGDTAFADLYRETLASVGWHVDVVHNWRSTRARLLKSLPDVLVLNQLPDMKQIDALENIRAHPATKALPVVLLTDTLDTGDLARAQELGVLGLLIKTRATRTALSDTLRHLLQNRSESATNGGTSGPRSTDSA
ncbi:MAG: response regulator [Chloroflexi bacterium]|nr:MAG: response regulator [Chloroflexota bacterium]